MERDHFNNWTRGWGTAQSRRRTLIVLGGGTLAALLARLDREDAAACRKPKKACRRDRQCCSGLGSVCFFNKNGEGQCAALCPNPSPSQ